MKHKLFITISTALALLMTACDTGQPTEAEMKEYLTVLSYYYPYSLTDTFVFVNDDLGKTWEAYPYCMDGDTYPRTRLIRLSGKSTGWSAYVEADMVTKDISNKEGGILTYLNYAGGIMDMHWDIKFVLNEDETIQGGYIITCSKDQLLSNLTDTILIPIPNQFIPGPPVIAPDGAYARIVKHQGLTDFSTDGKTVWKRVR